VPPDLIFCGCNAPNLVSDGAQPQTHMLIKPRMREQTALFRPLSWNLEVLLLKEKSESRGKRRKKEEKMGTGEKEKRKEREGRGCHNSHFWLTGGC